MNTMKDRKYIDWMRDYACANPVYGKCEQATQEMSKIFPELTRVRGHYDCPIWGERAHWWLIDVNGDILDPTASQFPSGGIAEFYQPWGEGKAEPTGMCPQCGGYSYDGATCCSDKCHNAYVAYVMG